MKQDKWGLPRTWRFWCDPMFWAYTAWEIVLVIVFAYSFNPRFYLNLAYGPVLFFWLVQMLLWASVYWLIYDTYRWMIPHRWLYFWFAALFWLLGFPYYLYRRPEYLQELERRRNLPY